MKAYYLPKDGVNPDTIYGSEQIVCISEKEVSRLSREWETDLMEQMREATQEEIGKYGVYDG